MSSVYDPRLKSEGSSSHYEIGVSEPFAVLKKKGTALTITSGTGLVVDTGLKLKFYIKSSKINEKDQPGHSSILLFNSAIEGLTVTAYKFMQPNGRDVIELTLLNTLPSDLTINSGDSIAEIAVAGIFKVTKLH